MRKNIFGKPTMTFMGIMVGISLCATGCSVNQDAKKIMQKLHQGGDTATEAEPSVGKEKLTVEDCVVEAYGITKTIGVEQQYSYEIEYHVPEIILDCDGAKILNQQILEDCQDVKLIETEQDYFPQWGLIRYDAYLNGEYLSVVVQKHYIDGGYAEYGAYNLNLETGEVATKEELAKYAGIPEGQLHQLVQKAAVYEVDKTILENITGADYLQGEEEQYMQEFFLENLEARYHTIEESNLELEQIPMYLSEAGELQAVIPIHTLAGAGIDFRPLSLNIEAAYKDFTIPFDDAVFVSYTDGNMTVRIEQTEWTENAFYGSSIEFGKEYPVEGVCKDYIQGEMLGLMNGDYVIPVFVSDDHTIAYLDLYECAQGGSFCLTEMARVSLPVEKITDENAQTIAEELSRYVFERYEGFSQRAMGLSQEQGCSLERVTTVEDGTETVIYQYMGFDEVDSSVMYFQEPDDSGNSIRYDGRGIYMGMNEKGMIFSFRLENVEQDILRKGMFSCSREYEWSEELQDFWIFMKYKGISGDELFPNEDEPLQLDLSFG